MKIYTTLTLAISLFASSHVTAQHAGMPGMDMPTMDKPGMESPSSSADKKSGVPSKNIVHTTTALVKTVDADKATVKLAHEPVASLNWPAMTMGFQVQDKSLFAKLVVGKKVTVEFVQQGKDYVITAVR